MAPLPAEGRQPQQAVVMEARLAEGRQARQAEGRPQLVAALVAALAAAREQAQVPALQLALPVEL